MKLKNFLFCFVLFVFLIHSVGVFAEAPALDPFYTKGHESSGSPSIETVSESVDPFSGYLSLVHTDLYLPGNGGLDLKIMRIYSSAIWGRRDVSFPGLVAVNELSPVGVGWTMHLGIVRNPDGTGSDNRFIPDNPVIVMQDGSSHVMYKDKNDASRFIGKDFMIYKKRTTGIYDLTLADGTKYTFQYNAGAGYITGDKIKVAQVTSITRPGGGASINVVYDKKINYTYMKTVTDSLGRVVQFNYDYSAHKLTSIVSGSRTISYNYQGINVGTQIKNFLTQVSLPVGNPWKYEYNTTVKTFDLKKMTYPAGGIVDYTYSDIVFPTGKVNIPFRVVSGRTTSGRSVNGGTWTYNYAPGSSSGDTTTINGPDGYKEVCRYNGWGNCPNGSLWKLGLPLSRVVSIGGSTVHGETYTWSKGNSISSNDVANANWSGQGGIVYDSDIFIPLLTESLISRDGKNYKTTYGSYDAYGNPKTKTETGDLTRTTSIVYWYNKTLNIVLNKPSLETVTISGASGSISNACSYTSDGNLKESDLSGVVTSYTYSSNGNLVSETNANGRTTSYAWTNGRVSKIVNPEYTKYKTIGINGTVLSVTDGRGNRTSFTYDDNLRLTSETPPTGNKVSYTYSSDYSSKRETHGNYYTIYYHDGFNRPTGSSNRLGVTDSILYKKFGSKNYTKSNIGDTIYYDYSGRVTQIVHKDNNTVNYTYSGSSVTIKDEDGKNTLLTYHAFGNPEEKRLVKVTDPLSKATSYTYNVAGNLTGITQGSISRVYGYNPKFFLTSETHPDKGTISYGRDNIGNMTSKTDALGTLSYTYDGVNRLIKISGGNKSIVIGYDKSDNRTSLSNSSCSTVYTHDASNRMTGKTTTISGKTYATTYVYNANDMITGITYPSGRVVTYAYNDNNQPISVTGFGGSVTNIVYHTTGTAIGLPRSYSYSNGITTNLTYTYRNMVSKLQAGTIMDYQYTYDRRGNTLSITNSVNSIDNQTFGYDALNRLTMFNGSAAYTYDMAGNRLSKSIGPNNSSTYNYSGNRLTSVTGSEPATFNYNGNGDLTSMNGNSLSYDIFRNVVSYSVGGVTKASFAYDGDNLRLGKTSDEKTVLYHNGQDGNILSETDGDGVFIADNIYLFGKLVARSEDAPVVVAAKSVATAKKVNPLENKALSRTLSGTSEAVLNKQPEVFTETDYIRSRPIFSSHVGKSSMLSLTPELSSGINARSGYVEWQIGKDPGFGEKVLQATLDASRRKINVPSLVLDGGVTYYVRTKLVKNGSYWTKPRIFITGPPSWNDENGNGVPDDMDLETETDLDGNGVSDAYQEGFKVLATFDEMDFVGVKAMDNVLDIECLQSVSPGDVPDVTGRPHDLPFGLVGMRLLTEKPGDVVRVEMHFPEPVPENSRVFGYDTLNGWQDLSGKAAVSSDGKRIILTLEDGGKGDADGCKNGVIVRTLGIGTVR